MNLGTDRSTIVVGVSFGLVLLVVLYCIASFWFLRQDYADQIDTIAPRTARLLGMVESSDKLVSAHSMAKLTLHELAYPVGRDGATTAAGMQRDVRELMTEAGLSISGSQVLPRQKEQGFDRLTLDITAEGNIDALEQALVSLESIRPLVFVTALNIKPSRVSRRRVRETIDPIAGDTRKITARFQLISLRLKN